jgi:hypothetical protein
VNRFRREFCKWARAERLEAFYVPRKPEDWDIAKAASRMAHAKVTTPEFRAHMVKIAEDAIMENRGRESRAGGMASWLAPL